MSNCPTPGATADGPVDAGGHPRSGSGDAVETGPEGRPLVDILYDTLAYARRREYRGPDYGDGMSSRLLQALPVDNRWLNLAVQELIKRPPVDLRPLFLVEERRNYQGASLFAMANLNTSWIESASTRKGDGTDYAAEAGRLLDWVVLHRSVGFSGFCGGHMHAIQHLDGDKGLPNHPDLVSTSYAAKALLAGADLDPVFPVIARTAADFAVEDLRYREVDDGARIDYYLHDTGDDYTINAGALGARLFADLYAAFGTTAYRRRATAILDHIATLQTDRGGWYYRDPPEASHLSMDSHHNAFVLETYLRYADVVDASRFADTIERALEFYRGTLFEPDGTPNWDESSAYPKDVHACANGILVFTYAGDLEFASRIVDWTLANLYAGDGRFYFRKHRLYTDRRTLMRWCQAWMAFALSEYLAAATVADGKWESAAGVSGDVGSVLASCVGQ